MIKAGIGINKNFQDYAAAAKQAADQAKQQLMGVEPSLIIAFASVRYDQAKVVQGIKAVFPNTPLVGGSAAGEIVSGSTTFDAVNVMAITADKIRFTIGKSEGIAKDSFQAAAQAAQDLIKKTGGKKPDLVISLFDGMTGNGAALVEGLKSVLGENFPIIGGSMGDDYHFKKTYEYYNADVLTDAVVLVGLTGEFSFGFGIRHGWEPIGLPLKVTKADGVILKELNNEPALNLYSSHFGKQAADLVREPLARMAYTYPIGITVEGSNELLIRDPVIANEQGEITMAAAIPEGTTVRLMIGDRDKAITAAQAAARTAKEQLAGSTPKLIIMFNCMARNKLLGIRCAEENQVVQDAIGTDVPLLGFYTYGEHGPLLGKKNSPAYFHNETMTLLVLGE